jgi:LysM repeat protein
MSNVQGSFAPSYSIGHTVVRGGGDVAVSDDFGDMPPMDTPLPTRPPRVRIGAERGSSEICHAWELKDWKPKHARDGFEGKRLIDCRTPVPGFPTRERCERTPDIQIFPREAACPPKDCGPEESGVRWGTVTVRPGDDLNSIAREHGTTWQHVFDANKDQICDPNLIHPGQKLRVPVGEDWNQGCAPKAPACEPAPPKCEPAPPKKCEPAPPKCDTPAPPKNDCPPPPAPAPAPPKNDCPPPAPAPCPPNGRPNNDAARVLNVIGGVLGGIASGFNGGVGMNGGFGMNGGIRMNGGIGMGMGPAPMPIGPMPMGPMPMGPMPVGVGGFPIAGPAPIGPMPAPVQVGPMPGPIMGPPMKGPVAGPPQKF